VLEAVLAWGLGAVAVAAAVAVFCVDSMARATYALLLSFLAVAVELVLLGSVYLGILTVLMMTIEMAIMGVFMLMYMMNPAGLMPMSMVHNHRGALVLSVGTFLGLGAGVLLVRWPQRRGSPPPDVTFSVGEALMGRHMLAMIVIGVGLLATMVSGIMLATTRGRYDRYGDRLERARPHDPVPGAGGR
jgi:NADH-quinone oxidoreductase subunit J